MRIFPLLLLLASLAFAAEPEITYFLDLDLETSCPGDLLHITAIASNGDRPADIELRLVRYYPYQGLRALKHTDENGEAVMELTKTGEYRIYIGTDLYDHEKFVTFNYSEMCPPPPPKSFDLSIEPDCENGIIIVTAKENGSPLKDVFLWTENSSALTQSGGQTSFPLIEGWFYITANKSGYTSAQEHVKISCIPPDCLKHEDCATDQYCANEECIDITGECGFAENHTWFNFPCCNDSDCEEGFACRNNTCLPPEPPVPQLNVSNTTQNVTQNISQNVTETPEETSADLCLFPAFAFFMVGFLTMLFRF